MTALTSQEQAAAEEEAYLRSLGKNEVEANRAASSLTRLQKLVAPNLAFGTQKLVVEGKLKTLYRARKSDWIHNLIYLDGKKFDFAGREYLRTIYDANYKKKLLMTGRQVEKSTMLANEFIINSVIRSYFKSLYVSPSHDQTRTFSNQKLKPWIEDSPIIDKYFQSSKVSKQVFERSFTNGSIGFLRSAFLNADRTRGISADILFLDELQDLLINNIPVIEETLSHSKEGYEIFAGTPKTLENTIQQYWERSSMCEWLVPCTRHAPVHWNYLDEKCIGKEGPICNKCGHAINPPDGRWIAFNSDRDIMGFRISQLMVPWFGNQEKWKTIITKLETYPTGQFKNECLGISYDSASKPITRTDLIACCTSLYPFRRMPDPFTRRLELFAGVDWGEGTDGSERGNKGRLKTASYTVLCIGTYLAPGKFHVLYYRRFTGGEVAPSVCVPEIINVLRAFGVKCTGVDYGFGWGVNERLEEAFGTQRVIRYQYVGMQRERKKFDDIGMKYQLSRTEVMTDFFEDIKKGNFIWPEWEGVKDYLCDIEHIYAEYSESQRALKYDHKSSEPDDACHATILCREAADNYYGIKR